GRSASAIGTRPRPDRGRPRRPPGWPVDRGRSATTAVRRPGHRPLGRSVRRFRPIAPRRSAAAGACSRQAGGQGRVGLPPRTRTGGALSGKRTCPEDRRVFARQKEKSPRCEARANPPKEEVEETGESLAKSVVRCNIPSSL